MITKLLKENTQLEDLDIKIIEELGIALPSLAAKYDSDVCIYVLRETPNKALIAAHASPGEESVYCMGLGGKKIRMAPNNKILRCLLTGECSEETQMILRGNILIKQSILPIKSKDKIIGVLSVQKGYNNQKLKETPT